MESVRTNGQSLANSELISVIVPVYNVESLIERCVGSILRQTHNQLEVIIVDDGSTDRSFEVCSRIAKDDSRVRLVKQANGGVSAARNSGLALASGDFITFVDSDDWIDADFLEVLLGLIKQTNADIALGGIRHVDSHFSPQNFDGNGEFKDDRVLSREQALDSLCRRSIPNQMTVWAKLYRRHCIDGMRFPTARRLAEDEFMAHRLLIRSSAMAITEKSHYYYWQHPTSLTGVIPSESTLTNSLDAFLDRMVLIKREGMSAIWPLALEQAVEKHIALSRLYWRGLPNLALSWSSTTYQGRTRFTLIRNLIVSGRPRSTIVRSLLRLTFPRLTQAAMQVGHSLRRGIKSLRSDIKTSATG